MSQHWKHRATRCAVEGCERTRVKGHSTCALLKHHELGKPLAGAGKIEPIPAPVVFCNCLPNPPRCCNPYQCKPEAEMVCRRWAEESITRPGPTVYRNGPIPTRDVAGEWDRRDEEGQ